MEWTSMFHSGKRLERYARLEKAATSFWRLAYKRLHFTAQCGHDVHLHQVMVVIEFIYNYDHYTF